MRGALAALALLILAVLPAPAAAHLYLESSQPADEAHLNTVPREIRLRFSEPVELVFTRVELLGPDGNPVRLAEPVVSEGEPNVLVAGIQGALQPGPYSVVWRTTSADGHPVSGQISFSVDEEAEGVVAAAADEPAATSRVHHDPAAFPDAEGFTPGSPGYIAVRWITFISLLGIIGVVAFKFIVLGMIRRGQAPEGLALVHPATARSINFGLAFSLLLAIAVLARLYAQSLALHRADEALDWTTISAILSRTTWGLGWVLQAAATGVVIAGFAVARHRSRWAEPRAPQNVGLTPPRRENLGRPKAPPPRTGAETSSFAQPVGTSDRAAGHGVTDTRSQSGSRIGWVLAAIGTLVLAFTPALAGHAVAAPDYAWLAVLSDGLHVLGGGGWLGSLLAVVVIGIPMAMRLGEERRGSAIAVLVNAFSPTALFFAAIVTATGVVSAVLHLGTFADLWQSGYGRTLLLKIGVLSLLFATGAYNWLRVRPALRGEEGAQRLRRSAGLELAVGVVVLLITGVLVATPPPMGMRTVAEQAAAEASP